MAKAVLDKAGIATKPGYVTVYNFDWQTFEYISSSVEFLANGVGIPANSSVNAPPDQKAGFAICFKPGGEEWEYLPDHRGETVYLKDSAEKIIINMPGDYPESVTTLPPLTPYDSWNGNGWETDQESKRNAEYVGAEAKKTRLLSEAKSTISLWQTELQLNIIAVEDKERLIAWVTYIKALQDVDVTLAPDIVWPVMPQ